VRVVIPPIKSQGIKTKLVPWIHALMPNAQGRWIEPFLGTGVVAFNSGFSKALLCDINPHIIRFYQEVKEKKITPNCVREYLEKEGRLLEQSPENGYEHFRLIRDRFNANHDPLDFLFLSRAGFNGMMRFNRRGQWNIPFCQKPQRFSPAYITKIVNQVHGIACLIQPAWRFEVATFDKIIAEATRDDFIYCDPPYIGRYVDYFSGWTEDDEHKLFQMLSTTPAKFILSTWHHNDFRHNPFVESLWGKFNLVTRDHFYHSGAKIENRRTVVEALIFNFPSDILEHNHGVQQKQKQTMLLETSPLLETTCELKS
jgi:DNA adenine methylase